MRSLFRRRAPSEGAVAPERRGWRKVVRRFFQTTGVLLLATVAVVLVAGWTAFGRRAAGTRLERMKASPEWGGSGFVNPQPLRNDFGRMVTGLIGASPDTTPAAAAAAAIPTAIGDRGRFESPPGSGVRVTWFGHSALLVEIEGHRILIDPAWSDRASPLGWAGPRRWYPPPIALADLPALDAVVISHDHYDHLDHRTILALRERDPLFIVPLGLGAHLESWGVPARRIVELDWWQRTTLGDLDVVCTPARHASGRMLVDNDAKLWGGFAFLGPHRRVYYSGDTGLFPAMRDIGERLGPFDLTMIEAGQYDPAWPDWHIGPEQAVRAHQMVRGRVLLPVHWGLFTLAYHGWTEPIERVLAAATRAGVTVVAPRPGQSFEPDAPPAIERWWPALPWKTAEERPVVSTQME